MTPAVSFQPDWISPPGDTIRDALDHHCLSPRLLGDALGLSPHRLEALFSGQAEIDGKVAEGLSEVLGGSPDFWLTREANYRARCDKPPAGVSEPSFDSFLEDLPLRDMKAFGWLTEAGSKPTTVAVREFFEDTPGGWARSGSQISEAVRFRTSTAHATNPVSVAAWLRRGVLLARLLDCRPWNPAALSDAIPEIRALTRIKSPDTFFPRLVEICGESGVAVVFVRTPAGCRASGATHFDADRAIIQLSFRYRSDDHFWFTVFHEIGHLLLHPETPLFVEGRDYDGSQEESEANQFAADTLVPPNYWPEIEPIKRDFRALVRLSRTIGVSPGVVIGQMQNRGLIRHDQLNALKVRYDWEALSRITL